MQWARFYVHLNEDGRERNEVAGRRQVREPGAVIKFSCLGRLSAMETDVQAGAAMGKRLHFKPDKGH